MQFLTLVIIASAATYATALLVPRKLFDDGDIIEAGDVIHGVPVRNSDVSLDSISSPFVNTPLATISSLIKQFPEDVKFDDSNFDDSNFDDQEHKNSTSHKSHPFNSTNTKHHGHSENGTDINGKQNPDEKVHKILKAVWGLKHHVDQEIDQITRLVSQLDKKSHNSSSDVALGPQYGKTNI